MFFRHRKHEFQHTYIYVDERKDKLADIKQRALNEIAEKDKEYRASKIRGFLTNKTYKHRISTTTAVLLIVIFAVLWYFLIY